MVFFFSFFPTVINKDLEFTHVFYMKYMYISAKVTKSVIICSSDNSYKLSTWILKILITVTYLSPGFRLDCDHCVFKCYVIHVHGHIWCGNIVFVWCRETPQCGEFFKFLGALLCIGFIFPVTTQQTIVSCPCIWKLFRISFRCRLNWIVPETRRPKLQGSLVLNQLRYSGVSRSFSFYAVSH